MALATIDTWPRHLTAGLITGYQRYLSPYKGFSCAHRVLHKGESCSQYVKQVILERGLSDAWPLIQTRFQDCRTAHNILKARRHRLQAIAMRLQSSDDDIPDSPEPIDPLRRDRKSNQSDSCNGLDCGCEGLDGLADCADCAGDWPNCSGLDCSGSDCAGLDLSGCDGGCDVGSCDVGGCDAGGCDVGSCG